MKREYDKESSLTSLKEIDELAGLYDLYGALLKESKQRIFEDYIYENLSLSEISSKYDMTRQGVYDVINRSRRKLREYDEKLRLTERYDKIHDILDEIEDKDTYIKPQIEKIRELL